MKQGEKRKHWNRTRLGLAAAACLLAGSAASGRALAYFTDYVEASGSAPVALSFPNTEIEEEVSNWTKHVVVRNTGDCDCYVRVAAYAGRELSFRSEGETGWTPGEGGYYYYGKPLAPGEASDALLIGITAPGAEDTDDFNVIVVSEHTQALWGEDGEPAPGLSWEAGGNAAGEAQESGEQKEGTAG